MEPRAEPISLLSRSVKHRAATKPNKPSRRLVGLVGSRHNATEHGGRMSRSKQNAAAPQKTPSSTSTSYMSISPYIRHNCPNFKPS
ncbi:hypothetical protein COLO4_04531 [Corchorus olitorius]|uniref:Uncharacterized protein n=1 Tax=Corchorus olitorius TaxID=93759 RepID=A0A1R3KTJ3_9ROSI|nr:hypothetical protein COLO4_04531 [Corchorus olitorius]